MSVSWLQPVMILGVVLGLLEFEHICFGYGRSPVWAGILDSGLDKRYKL